MDKLTAQMTKMHMVDGTIASIVKTLANQRHEPELILVYAVMAAHILLSLLMWATIFYIKKPLQRIW